MKDIKKMKKKCKIERILTKDQIGMQNKIINSRDLIKGYLVKIKLKKMIFCFVPNT